MPVSVTWYNHTAARFRSGANAPADEYIINLYTVLPANVTATTKAAAESGATQLPTLDGYTQNAKVLAGVAVATVDTNGSRFDADSPSWTASGSGLTANFAMVYNNTDADDPPLFRVDFDAAITAAAGIPLVVEWNAAGILTDGYA